MTDPQQQLREYESQMRLLIQIRGERKRTAELASKKADVEFDRDAIPLARKINALREQIEESKPVVQPPREHKPKHIAHDPEWSQEEIDHYYELQRR